MFEKHSIVIFFSNTRGLLGNLFANIAAHFLFFYFFFLRFVSLGGFPLNMVVVAVCCGLFLMDFKSRLKSKRKLQKTLLMMF